MSREDAIKEAYEILGKHLAKQSPGKQAARHAKAHKNLSKSFRRRRHARS